MRKNIVELNGRLAVDLDFANFAKIVRLTLYNKIIRFVYEEIRVLMW